MSGSNKISRSTSNPGDEKRSTDPPGILYDPAVERARKWNTEIPDLLPHERVFPIQIGSQLFRLSGASISSDDYFRSVEINCNSNILKKLAEKPRAPSYFSQFFLCQLKQAEENSDHSNTVRTLYIDRDPVTFTDISLHLQGYHVSPRDGGHFVRLFADAQFYSLPRLMSQLYEESIFISIGHRDFQIPREIFSDPGNTPNYFSLGFAVFFTTPPELFPGLGREGLLRPPSILPPAVPNRSADIFTDILHLLRGYPVHIRNKEHREELLRDCRYFHLKGLEQKLIKHDISFNLARQKTEIVLRLEDIRQSGISIVPSPESTHGLLGWVNYARPFVDDKAYELVLEIGGECSRLHLNNMRAEFSGDGKTRVTRLFEVIATKLNLPTVQPLGLLMKNGGANNAPASPGNTPISQDQVKIALDSDSWIQLDGKEWKREKEDFDVKSFTESPASSATGPPSMKRRRIDMATGEDTTGEDESWIIRTGQWRLRIQQVQGVKRGVECVLVAVKLDAVSGELARNARRGFLAG